MRREFPDSRPVHIHGARKVRDLSSKNTSASPSAWGALESAPEELIRVTVVLNPASDTSNKGQLPASLDTGHASVSELEDLFAPSPDDVELIRQFALEHGLNVVEVSKLRHDVVLEGTADALSAAFNIQLAHYEHEHGSYRAHDEHIHLPEELHDKVEAVLGLDNIPCHRRHFAVQMEAQVGTATTTTHPLMNPRDVADYYEFPDDSKGAGQRIAILEFGGGFYEDDINRFLDDIGLPEKKVNSIVASGGAIKVMEKDRLAEITKAVNENGQEAIQKYGNEFGDWTHMLEVTMDIELVAALAPDAEIDVYFIGNTSAEFREALYGLLSDAASTDGQRIPPPMVISHSWGNTEESYGVPAMKSIEGALDALRRARITVCCASGDFGSVGHAPNTPATTANVCFPASSPSVIACGGTTLSRDDGQLSGEVVWNEYINGLQLASTGGISGHFPQPAWQSDVQVPIPSDLDAPGTWLSAKNRDNPGFRGRGIPDVAASADIARGFHVVLGGVETAGGGTSAAAPLWASLLACINQQCNRQLGFINSRLYSLMGQSVFRQAVAGDNDIDNAVPYFSVRPATHPAAGWNPCTGLGSPVGIALLEKMKKSETRRLDRAEEPIAEPTREKVTQPQNH
ncbi:MAG: S53 family peptidase [Planctomycetota bacterium]|jgi:kumamolisin